MVCDKVYRVRTDEMRLMPEFMELLLNSHTMLLALNDMKTGTSESGMNLTQRKFLAMEVDVPGLEAQRQSVVALKNVLGVADVLEERLSAAEGLIARGPRAVLAKAFRGELVGAGKVAQK